MQMIPMMPYMIKIKIPIAKLIQSGEKTHHQDQSILSKSLNITKTMVSRPGKPIPAEVDELSILNLPF